MWHAIADWLQKYESIAIWLEGVALVLILFLDWREYRRQGKERAEQHKESAQQLAIMQSQADATRENAMRAKEGADAAKANAEAAKLNAVASAAMLELIVNKERARIRVEMKPLDLTFTGIGVNAVEYTVRLYGTSEARVLESGAEVSVDSSLEPDNRNGYMMPAGLPEVLTPVNPVHEKSTFFMSASSLNPVLVDRIRERKAFVHFRGFIKYRDVFDKERETKFLYLWNVTEWVVIGKQGELYSYWAKCGKEGDNIET